MKPETRAKLSIALVFVAVIAVIVGSDRIATWQATKLGLQDREIVVAKAKDKRVPATALEREIVVARKGVPVLTFTDDRAVAFELASIQRELNRFEAALRKDLTRGDFGAPRTRRAISTAEPAAGGATADQLASTRDRLDHLRAALREDLAAGEFRAQHTRRLVARGGVARSYVGDAAVARGVVALSDGIWNLEMAIEQDIHDGDFKAVETHFAIDRRRWKVG